MPAVMLFEIPLYLKMVKILWHRLSIKNIANPNFLHDESKPMLFCNSVIWLGAIVNNKIVKLSSSFVGFLTAQFLFIKQCSRSKSRYFMHNGLDFMQKGSDRILCALRPLNPHFTAQVSLSEQFSYFYFTFYIISLFDDWFYSILM